MLAAETPRGRVAMMPNDADGRRGFEAVATEGVQVSPPATRRSPRRPDLGQPVDEHDLTRVVFGLPHRGSGTEAIRVAVSVAV